MTDDREGADAADGEGGEAADGEGGEAADGEGGEAADGEGGEAADVDAATVRHVASLARVDLDDDEVERFADQFAEILGYFEALEDVPDVDGEPDLVNVMGPDEVTEGLTQAEALRNAPETEDGRFTGPRVS
jgi:aspartyl-tRNA(Asn)/glutamyl-tRNA(Gln) amidotransferase subunit C